MSKHIRNTGIDLTSIINKILNDLKMGNKINTLINHYIYRKNMKNVNEIKMTKSKVATALKKDHMSWGVFKYLLLDIINPKSITFTIEIEYRNNDIPNSEHSFFIDNTEMNKGDKK